MGSKMITYLPLFMRKSKIYKEIFNSEEKQLMLLEADIKDIKKQLNIDTATWALSIYEEELGIKTDLNKTFEERRSIVKSKWRGTGKVDARLIQVVAEAYSNGEVAVSFDGSIIVKFVGARGIPPNIEDLEKAINDIKPAHLPFRFQFTYLTWSEFDAYNKTWDEWDSLNLTWDELETYRGVI
ncbi:YmfQ family protein [Alkaliphilus peptidifermentans]|uniref:DUF2313 domain-containing protein n=1 Tax=Alkaliphilus peptidifermentans DSM 18978 TaxID=1120976 RepID=A0A1G5JXP6_9FIRM|nr:YmfQ family protein [Alkaliphilus peptidifermentans]SCY92924.1 hypothetical protein SAMN03080606_03092 [Alkaliphilus peptidifermentans DSM 18978]